MKPASQGDSVAVWLLRRLVRALALLAAVAGGLAFLAVGRRASFFDTFFRIVPVFLRVALLTVRFLRLALILPLVLALAFFFVAIAAS
jgi:cellulose synthase/poly-beta-1,6-N-acetylglucosamine synthase-like glycosyltransferase